MARRVSEEDRVYLRGAAGCLLSSSVRGGLRCTVVLHHFPKASPILQADCMHYHILCGSWKAQRCCTAQVNLCTFVHACACVCVPVVCTLCIRNALQVQLNVEHLVSEWRYDHYLRHLRSWYFWPYNIWFFLNLLFDTVFYYWSSVPSFFYLWTSRPVYAQQSSQGQFWMIHFVSSLCQSVSVYLSVFWLTGALQLFRSVQPRKKKHLANAAPYLSCSSNLLWAAGVEAEGLSLSRDVNLQPFQFHPALQSPSAWTISRPGQRCHLLFISSTIREKKKYCIL